MKRIFAALLFCLSFPLYAGQINVTANGVYSAVVIATVGAYLAANVTQKATAKQITQP